MTYARQWAFVADMNYDGVVTISDVWLWFKWIFFYPGDGFIQIFLRHAPSVAGFFEVTEGSYGGVFSGLVSVLAYLIVFGSVAAAIDESRVNPKP